MSEAVFTLDAEIREDLGKGASRRLRHTDKVPAVVYGGEKPAVSITLDHSKVLHAQEHEAFYSHILTLNIDNTSQQVILKDVQRHAFKPKILHMDFLRVDADHAITTTIPLHFINEETAEAVKMHGGVVSHTISEVEISCLPQDLPEFIEVDVAKCEMGSALHLSDIDVPKGVTLVELTKGEDHDQPVVSIKAPKAAADEDDSEAGEEGGEE